MDHLPTEGVGVKNTTMNLVEGVIKEVNRIVPRLEGGCFLHQELTSALEQLSTFKSCLLEEGFAASINWRIRLIYVFETNRSNPRAQYRINTHQQLARNLGYYSCNVWTEIDGRQVALTLFWELFHDQMVGFKDLTYVPHVP